MTDIVERVVAYIAETDPFGDRFSAHDVEQIERLRADLEACEHDLDVFHLLIAVMSKAFADDKRFLAALKQTNAKLRKRKKPAG